MRIYAFINSTGVWGSSNVGSVALGEDGRYLAGHVSSDAVWAEHGIGVTSNWHHEAYDAAYPDGWEIVWLGDPSEMAKDDPHRAGFLTAIELHEAAKAG